MDEYSFKDTEIGGIPKEWGIAKLESIFTPINLRTRIVLIKPNTKYKLILTKLYNKGVKLKNVAESNKIKAKFMYYVKEGDFIFSKINVGKGALGFIDNYLDGSIVSSEHPILRLDTKIAYQEYIRFYFSQEHTWKLIKIEAKGFGGKERIKVREFLKFLIILPSLDEQTRIAYVLSTIQNAIEIQDKMIEALQKLKKSMMHKLFTEGIGNTESKDTEIGRIPKEWNTAKLSDLFFVKHGISITPNRRSKPANFPMLRTLNVYWGKISLDKLDHSWFSEKEIEELNLLNGDLLVCEGGDIGRTAMWTGQTQKIGYQNHIHRLRSRINDIYPLFYAYWMQYAIEMRRLYINQGNKTTIPNLSQSRLMRFYVVYPPYESQRSIGDILQVIDSRISTEQDKKEVIVNLFKTMLNKLMTGHIRVKNLVMPS